MRKEQSGPRKFSLWGFKLRLTHQDPAGPSLAGDELSRPVLGAGHEIPALPPLGPLLLLQLLLLVGGVVVLHLPAEHSGAGSDEED